MNLQCQKTKILVNMNIKKGILTKKFGLKVKMERMKRNLSQERLAELAKLNKNSIGAIERGDSSPTFETIGLLAEAFDIEIVELTDLNNVKL